MNSSVLNDQQGIIYRASKEEEAFVRWQRGEFLDLERQIAKEWRKGVSSIDNSQAYETFRKLYASFRRPKDPRDAKDIAEALVNLLQEFAADLIARIRPALVVEEVQRPYGLVRSSSELLNLDLAPFSI
jgi:hypothetical protein